MRWGLDCAYMPDAQVMKRQHDWGFSWVAGYIGGRAEHVWPAMHWIQAFEVGLDVLPIWVAPLADDAGRQAGVDDGNAALLEMQMTGLTGVLVLDVENGLEPIEYAAGFLDAVSAGDCEVALYGTLGTIVALQDIGFSQWWLARWGAPTANDTVIPVHFWQCSTGRTFDVNIADDTARFAFPTWASR